MDAIDSYAERPDQVVYLGLSTVFGPSAAPEGRLTVKADEAEVLSGALSGWPDARIVLISTQASSKGLPAMLSGLGPLALRRVDSAFEDLAVKVPFGRIHPLMKPAEYAELDRGSVVLRHIDWLRPRRWIAVDQEKAGWPEGVARQHLVLADGARGLLAPKALDRLLTVLEGNFGAPVTSGGAVMPGSPAAVSFSVDELRRLDNVIVHQTRLGTAYVLMADLDETARQQCQRHAGKRSGLLRLEGGVDAVFLEDYRLWVESIKAMVPEG